MNSLVVDWCSYKAAKYAVEHWHYSAILPFGKIAKLGVWENSDYIGCILFSYGATPHIGSPYGLTQFEICELTRIAMKQHKNSVSQCLSMAIKKLKVQSPGIRLIVSFADMEQQHYGIIYQASNWIYAGTTKPGRVGFVVNGKKTHTRSIGLKPGGIQSLEWVQNNLDKRAVEWIGTIKHRYLYPLDKGMRRQILPLAQPYPKRGQGVNGDTPTVQVGEAGSIPCCPL